MSLQTFDELNSKELLASFTNGKNVKILIAGLALCDISTSLSTIDFLRHVEHHELLMGIKQIPITGGNPKSITVKIDKTQNIEILDAEPNATSSILTDLVGMKTIHGGDVDQRGGVANKLSSLKIRNCNFFTSKMTNVVFQFDDTNGVTKPATPKPYCEILGGEMLYSRDLIISLGGDGLPLSFPINEFKYEIKFNNSCDSTPSCRDEEDFKYFYDIVKEKANPHRRFRMLEIPRATGTGACLPVCRTC